MSNDELKKALAEILAHTRSGEFCDECDNRKDCSIENCDDRVTDLILNQKDIKEALELAQSRANKLVEEYCKKHHDCIGREVSDFLSHFQVDCPHYIDKDCSSGVTCKKRIGLSCSVSGTVSARNLNEVLELKEEG